MKVENNVKTIENGKKVLFFKWYNIVVEKACGLLCFKRFWYYQLLLHLCPKSINYIYISFNFHFSFHKISEIRYLLILI